MTDRDLLEAAIRARGLSARSFARVVLLRDERTVRRWLAGDSPIPKAVVEWLGKSLRVHHMDGNPHNNELSNLVVKPAQKRER
jgi:hypothetical protein